MRTDGRHQAALSLIKTAMIEKKLTQAELADAADFHEKTIQNLLPGRAVRDQTLFDVCMVLGLDFDKVKGAATGEERPGARRARAQRRVQGRASPVYMGAYTRAAVDHYLGSYLTLRPSFSAPGGIMAYRTDIVWDDDWPSLVFQERDRPDKPYLHRGRLYIPAWSMFIHLVSLTKGAMRMVMVSQLGPAGRDAWPYHHAQQTAGALHAGQRAHRICQARRLRWTGLGEIGRDQPAQPATMRF